MKEHENHNRISKRIQIESIVKKKKEVEYKLENSIKPFGGHNIWEINLKTMEINLASFVKRKNINWFNALRFMKNGYSKDIQVKKDCVYISALNKKSALNRLEKEKGSAIMPKGNLKLKLY